MTNFELLFCILISTYGFFSLLFQWLSADNKQQHNFTLMTLSEKCNELSKIKSVSDYNAKAYKHSEAEVSNLTTLLKQLEADHKELLSKHEQFGSSFNREAEEHYQLNVNYKDLFNKNKEFSNVNELLTKKVIDLESIIREGKRVNNNQSVSLNEFHNKFHAQEERIKALIIENENKDAVINMMKSARKLANESATDSH